MLAPMAGVTNVAFRTLCRELEFARAGTVSGLYVCEMVTARALVERHPVTMHLTTFAPDESPRSLQLYTVDPDTGLTTTVTGAVPTGRPFTSILAPAGTDATATARSAPAGAAFLLSPLRSW